ncbi:FkbM family methyltransferase [Maritimibacter sp. UBA3975]|uniref:FkbM family methyltransferase n=1 Tax=Maritimibacter sp. UBA3975 TaxID=1946833 RepID=UPI0025BDE0E8|nr:FkbM family methyltransferase [Maritimibacter sp. UBA3975]
MRDFQEFVTHLKSLGYTPETVIDIGVAWGTPELYRTFPDAYFVLIEALDHFEGDMQRILSNVAGEYHLKGVGTERGSMTISLNLDAGALAGANVLDRPTGGAKEFTVEIDTVDAILAKTPVVQGALLKLDVQGADYRALQHATHTLSKCDVAIVEASLTNSRNHVRDITNLMHDRGFKLYEVFGPLNRPHDDAQGQVDLAFVRLGHPLIAYEGWV